jgi:hypothetical protein
MADKDVTEFTPVRLQSPTQCVLWEHPELAASKVDLELVEDYVRERHVRRSLYKCCECGQLYFFEWYEWERWDQHDEIYRTLIPVQNLDEIEALKAESVWTLMRYYPRLLMDDGKWIGKD